MPIYCEFYYEIAFFILIKKWYLPVAYLFAYKYNFYKVQ